MMEKFLYYFFFFLVQYNIQVSLLTHRGTELTAGQNHPSL